MEVPLASEQLEQQKQWQSELATLEKQRKTVTAQGVEQQAERESELLAALADPPKWRVLEVEKFASTGGEETTIS